ncbi:MAG: hypothetical protein K8R91_04920, partial [Phycisphaerae bacterium]|nr:hypothetical protein [Phycisphaerae bacterium]
MFLYIQFEHFVLVSVIRLVTIPAEAVRPELSYHHLLTVASDTTLSVEITIDDGLNWTEAASFSSAYNRSDWTLRRVALDGYQGETIRMRLRA